jgi:hypothetical protein
MGSRGAHTQDLVAADRRRALWRAGSCRRRRPRILSAVLVLGELLPFPSRLHSSRFLARPCCWRVIHLLRNVHARVHGLTCTRRAARAGLASFHGTRALQVSAVQCVESLHPCLAPGAPSNAVQCVESLRHCLALPP